MKRLAQRPHVLAPLGLVLILLAGAWLRLSNVDWDDGHHLHPDERFIAMVGTAIQLPSGVAEYFDTSQSPLNPYNRGYNSFVYGTYPLFLVRALAEPLDMTGYERLHLLGRVVSALHDLGTVLMVSLIGRHLYGRRVGLLAALLLAFTALHIQQAHFFTVDAFLVFYLSAAFYCTLRALEGRSRLWYLLAGAALGLAMASKINAVLFGAVLAAAIVVDWLRSHQFAPSPEGDVREFEGSKVREVESARSPHALSNPRTSNLEPSGWSPLTGSVALGLTALVVFRVAQPYAFAGPSPIDVLPNPVWLDDLARWQAIASGQADYPPSHQWAETTPYLFPLRHMLLWGLGLPLGLAALAGVGLASAQAIRRWPHHLGHLLVLVWIAVNFWYFGGGMAKTMRYFLPIYPFLALLAAYFLFWLLDRRKPRDAREAAAAGVVLAVVAVGTILYGLAFSSVYHRPVTRVVASEWIYDTLPPGSAFAWEHWDDPLPLRLPDRPSVEPCDSAERDPRRLCSYQIALYDQDTPEKREKLIAILNDVDYLFLSSNRLYESIPRLPQRYPMTTEYYRLLFSGELGFRLEQTFTSYPSLFGIELNTDSAEEAFTVYDHPKVLIFRKTDDYSTEHVERLLSEVDLERVVHLRPVQVGQGGLLFSQAEWARQQGGGTWTETFDRDSLANRLPVAAWLVVVQLLALAVYPLTWRVLGGLADRGYLLAKLLGLLVASYLVWLLASLQVATFSRETVIAVVMALALASGLAVRQRLAELLAFVRRRWRLLALEEGLFLGAFGAFVLVRMANPDLWHPVFGGEKPMDFAYLNAVIRSSFFPPYDPWFAGGYINYYYFGFVVVATLVKLTGVVPWVAYNLAIPLFFALTVSAAFSFGHSLMSGHGRAARWPQPVAVGSGLVAALFVAVVGNLDALAQVLESLGSMGGVGFESRLPGLAAALNGLIGVRALLAGQELPQLDFWRSTRVIGPEEPGPISEFPYFTFLYGDLHAHLLALPITIAVVVVGLNLLRLAQAGNLLPAGPFCLAAVWRVATSHWFAGLALAAWLVGMLRATNTWDYPTYLALSVAAFGLAHFVLWRRIDARTVGWTAAAGAGMVVLSSLLYQPYLQRYAMFYLGLDPVRQTTSLPQYLVIFGGFLALVVGMLAVESVRAWRAAVGSVPLDSAAAAQRYHAGPAVPTWLQQLPLPALAPAVPLALVAGFSILGQATAAVIAALLALVTYHLVQPRRSVEFRYLLVLAGLGLALTLVPEVVALKGDIGRMNTVFKFYLQAWVLLALVAAIALPHVARRLAALAGPGSSWTWAWQVTVCAVIGVGLLYPLLASSAKLDLRFHDTPPTLDGMAYMQQAVYHDDNRAIPLGPDFHAINWLLDNVEGSPVVVEAFRPHYRWGARVSIYTGLPTVLGWDWHQKQQRGEFAWMVDRRVQDVESFYRDESIADAQRFLERYDVGYVYVGPLERTLYWPEGLDKFDRMVGSDLSVVYRTPEVTIYGVERAP